MICHQHFKRVGHTVQARLMIVVLSIGMLVLLCTFVLLGVVIPDSLVVSTCAPCAPAGNMIGAGVAAVGAAVATVAAVTASVGGVSGPSGSPSGGGDGSPGGGDESDTPASGGRAPGGDGVADGETGTESPAIEDDFWEDWTSCEG
jgi:hypothetical protein